ncbi:MAG: hypothetical protein SAL07_14790 [Oscillatoria sp. PMC 1051.18]|uniref:hypothetical protein n=1 Tax=Oscillatoria salina TaxID=331517 RepID=UPI0013B9DACC|nr:hypothetical protein [Oscillatoria salina]MBZ8182383.1 hypothetical protein [Oscillatoria salina IIICB1]MEC4893658.1 hypothetical protein [Oscillatoria sp. PMC 1050.18]MEC5031163.1 hypothetical protein [Oscillatoria sp. PMC 1051.18]NET90148.1 hypothetical protein [Kamptonema sp. SIO1D9]
MTTNTSKSNNPELKSVKNSPLSERQAWLETRRAILDLEAKGISDFVIFNALADLFHQRGEAEISHLLSEAAYRCYEK